MNHPRVIIFSDGACSPNPGIGGWAAILVSPKHGNATKEISGAERSTTNNRMELTAAVMALKSLKVQCHVELTTDSEYVQKAFTEGWLGNWSKNGWRLSDRKRVANADLWQQLLELTERHKVVWHWTKGHADDPLNNRCDELAVSARLALADQIARENEI